MKIKINDNLMAIFTYIHNNEYRIDLDDFIQYCIDYEYYKELYENWHIVRDCINYHNDNLEVLNAKRLQKQEENS